MCSGCKQLEQGSTSLHIEAMRVANVKCPPPPPPSSSRKQRVEQRIVSEEQLQEHIWLERGGRSGDEIAAAPPPPTHARGGRCRRHRRCVLTDRLRGVRVRVCRHARRYKKKFRRGRRWGAAPSTMVPSFFFVPDGNPEK